MSVDWNTTPKWAQELNSRLVSVEEHPALKESAPEPPEPTTAEVNMESHMNIHNPDSVTPTPEA